MSSKTVIYVSMVIGSMIGGWIPSMLWNAETFDLSGVFFTAIGGALGIYIGWLISR